MWRCSSSGWSEKTFNSLFTGNKECSSIKLGCLSNKVLIEALVDREGKFSENEHICRNMIEFGSLYILDGHPEGANSLTFCNLDQEDVTDIITKYPTI